MTPLPGADDLPAAIPPPTADPDELIATIGRQAVYIQQLIAEMHRRAIEANRLHDQNLALQARLDALGEGVA